MRGAGGMPGLIALSGQRLSLNFGRRDDGVTRRASGVRNRLPRLLRCNIGIQ
jgi:hypothetical protein